MVASISRGGGALSSASCGSQGLALRVNAAACGRRIGDRDRLVLRVVQRNHIVLTGCTDLQAARRSKVRISISGDNLLQISIINGLLRDSAAISHSCLGVGIVGNLRCRPSFQILHRIAQIVPQAPVRIVRSRIGGEGIRIRLYLSTASCLCVPTDELVTHTDRRCSWEIILDRCAGCTGDGLRHTGDVIIASIGIKDDLRFLSGPLSDIRHILSHGISNLRLPTVKRVAGLGGVSDDRGLITVGQLGVDQLLGRGTTGQIILHRVRLFQHVSTVERLLTIIKRSGVLCFNGTIAICVPTIEDVARFRGKITRLHHISKHH